MNKILKSRNTVMFPANVRIIHKNMDGAIIRETAVKNRVLKEYGLYSYARFIIGSFNNGALWDYKQYVPKYLAIGSNKAPLTGAPGTETAVQVTDLSLYHELIDVDVTGEALKDNRIKISRANYIEDNDDEPYVKIQFEAYIPEDRFVGCEIGEMALMTEAEGWNAYARITGFEPFVKQKREVILVIWEITVISIESSTRYLPTYKGYLREAIEKAIDVLEKFPEDPTEYPGIREELNHLIQPATIAYTGLYYLLNENEQITQDVVNNYLSKPFIDITNSGLIPMIQKIDPNWVPNWDIVE